VRYVEGLSRCGCHAAMLWLCRDLAALHDERAPLTSDILRGIVEMFVDRLAHSAVRLEEECSSFIDERTGSVTNPEQIEPVAFSALFGRVHVVLLVLIRTVYEAEAIRAQTPAEVRAGEDMIAEVDEDVNALSDSMTGLMEAWAKLLEGLTHVAHIKSAQQLVRGVGRPLMAVSGFLADLKRLKDALGDDADDFFDQVEEEAVKFQASFER
jgi:hypothetical protein